jgi:hypothetical protein
VIERHGGTALGSTRAAKQRWGVNMDTQVVEEREIGFRQVRPPSPRLDVEPLAEELFRLIADHRGDGRLKWLGDGSVQVLIGKVISDEGPKQTVTGRRRRFREALDSRVRAAGGEVVRANVYRL